MQFCQWVYDWHIHRFGLTKLAEINLADLIKSVQTSWKENSKVAHFGQLTAIVQSRNLLRWSVFYIGCILHWIHPALDTPCIEYTLHWDIVCM